MAPPAPPLRSPLSQSTAFLVSTSDSDGCPFYAAAFHQNADLKNFVDYLEEAYCCFLEGDDEAYQAITTEYSEAREGEDGGAEEFLRKLEETNEALAQTNQEVSGVHAVRPRSSVCFFLRQW